MKHIPKLIIAALVFVFLSVAIGSLQGCSVDASNLPPDKSAQLAGLKERARIAHESGDQAQIAAAEQALDEFEAQVLRDRAGPIVAGLASINPLLAAASPLIMGLVPMLGKRGRSLALSAVQNLNPWGNLEPGEAPNVAPIEAAKDLLAYIGMRHTSPASEAAANGAPLATGSTA